MIELKNISHSYGPTQVLSGLSLTLNPGERLAIMGPSGCGKTTLLRIILGLTKATSGTARNTFAKCGTVFQEPRLLPWRTALENVNLVLGDGADTLASASRYLAQVGLGDAKDKLPAELSGGMQQRVALARALAMDGDCLILDEPFKAMDETLRWQIIELVNKTKGALLLITHDEQEAQYLNCRILKL